MCESANPRWDFERAVMRSDLAPLTRLVLLALATHIDQYTGVIPADRMPSLTKLARETGMSRSTLAVHLTRAEEAKWIERDRPTVAAARYRHEQTMYVLQVPPELVRETDQPSAGDVLASPGAGPASPGAGLEASPGAGLASPGAGHKSDKEIDRSRSDRDILTTIQDTIRETSGQRVSREWAAQVHRQILGDRTDVKSPHSYVRTAIRREPARFRPTASEPNGVLPVPRVPPLGERDNPANKSGASLARQLMSQRHSN